MTYIPDPIERMQMRAESEIDKLTDEGYPCYICGQYGDPGDMVTITPDPSAPLIHWDCAEPTKTISDVIPVVVLDIDTDDDLPF